MSFRDIHLLLVRSSLGLSAIIALLVLRDRRVDPALRWLVIGMVIAGAAYSLLLRPLGSEWNITTRMLLRVTAAPGVAILWLTVHLLFDDRFVLRKSHLIAPLLLVVVA